MASSFAVGLLLTACYTGGPRDGRPGPGLTFGDDGLDDDGGSDDAGSDDGGEDGIDDAAAGLPTRRITRQQYNNIVADLLGDTTAPADALGPDARAFGYESNGEGELIALLSAEQYERVAQSVAARAVTDLPGLVGCTLAGGAEGDCIDGFIRSFGRRAFRRPVRESERVRLRDFYSAQRLDHDATESTRLLLQAILLSPQFLYRVEPEPGAYVDDFTMASRLSFLLWNTAPDDALLDAAQSGSLSSAEGVAEHARLMLDDPRAEAMVTEFHRQWLLLDWVHTAAKDTTIFPEYSLAIQDRLVAETQTFVADAILHGDGTLGALLASHHTFLDAELAQYYGLLPPDAPPGTMVKVPLAPDRSAGLLTQGAFLAAHATSTTTSPVRRGKFVRERILCGEVPAPPPGVDVTPPEPTPGTTTRQRYAEHSVDPVCASCHDMMDPIGLGFEHYDAIGRWRDTENGLTIDASVELIGVDAESDGSYTGLAELAEGLANSPTTRACVARQWFRFAYGRDDYAEHHVETVEELTAAFEASGGDVRELIVELTQRDMFLGGR